MNSEAAAVSSAGLSVTARGTPMDGGAKEENESIKDQKRLNRFVNIVCVRIPAMIVIATFVRDRYNTIRQKKKQKIREYG